MKQSMLLVSSNPDIGQWLGQALGGGAELRSLPPSSAAELLGGMDGHAKPSVMFFEVEDYHAPERMQLIEAVAERYPELPLVGLGSSDHGDVVLAAMRAGARDFFVLHRDDTKLAAQVGKLLRRAGAAAVGAMAAVGGNGKLFAVIGPNPQERIAFLASHLSLTFAAMARPGERTLLLDAASPAGAAGVMLNLTPSYTLHDAVADLNRCDTTLVDTAFTRHSSGCHLLCLPEDELVRQPMPATDFARMLQVFRSLFAVTVVACDGSAGVPLLRGLIAESDRSLLVTDQSILKSRQCKMLLRSLRLDDTPLDRTQLVVDNYRRRLGLEPANLAELIDLPLLATLSTEGVARIQAMNAGDSLFHTAPKDPYCDAVRRLAAALVDNTPKPATAASGGLLGRLFS